MNKSLKSITWFSTHKRKVKTVPSAVTNIRTSTHTRTVANRELSTTSTCTRTITRKCNQSYIKLDTLHQDQLNIYFEGISSFLGGYLSTRKNWIWIAFRVHRVALFGKSTTSFCVHSIPRVMYIENTTLLVQFM